MLDRTRYHRAYMARRRGSVSYKTLAEDAAVLLAVAAGEVTEGRGASTLSLDRVELRKRVNEMIVAGCWRCGVAPASLPGSPTETPRPPAPAGKAGCAPRVADPPEDRPMPKKTPAAPAAKASTPTPKGKPEPAKAAPKGKAAPKSKAK